jgi:hypothetical protein
MEWQPINNVDGKPKKGFMRIYTFAPVENKTHPHAALGRYYGLDRVFGYRVCDGFIDIPQYLPPEAA